MNDRHDAAADGSTFETSAPDATWDAPMCGPADVSQYLPAVMRPPNPPHAGKCSAQQAADYAACEGGATSKCAQFGLGQPSQACGQCIETQKTDKTWGVIVFDNSVGTLNIEGCIDDALQQLQYEKAIGGSGSCGDRIHALYGCEDAACHACIGDQLTTCINATLDQGCLSYRMQVEDASGPCKALLGDAGPPAASSCFADGTIKDLAQQRADFLTRMAQYMCGP